MLFWHSAWFPAFIEQGSLAHSLTSVHSFISEIPTVPVKPSLQKQLNPPSLFWQSAWFPPTWQGFSAAWHSFISKHCWAPFSANSNWYPEIQEQLWLPAKFSQIELGPQISGSFWHSSISSHCWKPRWVPIHLRLGVKPELQGHVYEPIVFVQVAFLVWKRLFD